MMGLCLRDRKRQISASGLFMANNPSWSLQLPAYTPHSLILGTAPQDLGAMLGRLPGNLRPGQGLEVGTSLEESLEGDSCKKEG